MSKYKQFGDYHFQEFKDPKSIYRAHVLDLIDQIRKVLEHEATILDVGCGEGLITYQLRIRGFQVTGCDTDPTAIELAKKHGMTLRHGDIFGYGAFDCVLLCDVLEHVDDFVATILEAKQLAPIVVVAVPDRHDKAAVRQNIADDVVQEFLHWEMVHCHTRHARHLMIFKKIENV